MTRIRRTVRGVGVLALAVPLSGAGILLSAAPALAATGITSPGDGTPYGPSHARVQVAASLDKNSGSAQLKLTSPMGGTDTVDSASSSLTDGASLSYALDTTACSLTQACDGRTIAANGQWRVTLASPSKVLDTITFTLRIPPKAPRSLSARADGYRAVVLTWPKGDEPDLTGWTVYGDGGVVQDNVGTDACSGTSCSSTVTYAQDGTGAHTYSVVAHRRTAPGSTETLDSGQSPQASATLEKPPPPPPPSPSPSPAPSPAPEGGSSGGTPDGSAASPSSAPGSPGGGTSGSGGTTPGGSGTTGGSPSGSSGSSTAIGTSKAPAPVTVAQRRAFALTFKAFAPKLGIPKLPPLPATAQPAVAPLPDGTYEKTLGYKSVVKREKVDSPRAAARRVTGAVGSALDSEHFARSIAGALLLLAAAHLRRWLGAHDTD